MKKLFNKKNPLFLLILSVLLLVSTIITPAQTANAVTDNVSLYYIDKDYRTHGYYIDTIYIKVANLNYEKNVSLHYKFDSDKDWNDATAEFVTSLDSNYDIFKVTVDGFGDIHYSIKYNVNNTEYIDDNNGNNYDDSYSLGSASVYAGKISGSSVSAVVKNYNAADAEVKIVYTTDGWNTTKTKTLNQYATLENNQLLYGCMLDYSEINSDFEYAIVYKANNVEYWDNNFNKNYNYTNHHTVC